MSGGTRLKLLAPVRLDGPLPSDLDPAKVLGEIRFGEHSAADSPFPCLMVRTQTLVPSQPWRALWIANTALREERFGRVRYRFDDELLFGVVAIDETEFDGCEASSALQQATALAYRELFAALGHADFPCLVRVWNYIPRINEIEGGIERYRMFNVGRQEAFSEFGRELTGRVPAASALGVRHGALEIGFIAARRPLFAIENPRQVSAYHYPGEYGPRSPTFSRAAVVGSPQQDLLFVSGTASIVGHQTLHHDDVISQARETLANISAVVGEAVRTVPTLEASLHTLACLGYVRNPSDLAVVRNEMRAALGDDKQFCYVQADVCRVDLLVEVEASGGHARAM